MVFLSFYRRIIRFGFVFLTELCGDGDVLLHGENPLYRAVDHAVDRLIGVESHVSKDARLLLNLVKALLFIVSPSGCFFMPAACPAL